MSQVGVSDSVMPPPPTRAFTVLIYFSEARPRWGLTLSWTMELKTIKFVRSFQAGSQSDSATWSLRMSRTCWARRRKCAQLTWP